MEMSYKEIGNMIKKLKNGESVHCPQCEDGEIMPKRKGEVHFKCTKCNFVINID